ncbi:hypothetical protein N9Y38_00395 [Flavobacteriaceae bacterium]|nr:hypothetical protein [Flavobacteriaceae bacterium]
MKILVGIIHSNEPQVDDCIKSVNNQKFNDYYDYFVISGLTKREAHDKLYLQFMNKKDEFDIFIKLDGDMVIERSDFFSFIENKFSQNINLDWIRLEVFDYFLKENISGLNIYRNSVRWNTNSNNFFTDRTMIKNSVRNDLGIVPSEKWITHCKDGSLYQAFNFAFHRAIKAFQFNSNKKIYSTLQWIAFLRIRKLNSRNPSKITLIMIASLAYVVINKIGDSAINEKSKEKKDAFLFLSNLSVDESIDYVKKSLVLNYLSLGKIGFFLITFKFYLQSKFRK